MSSDLTATEIKWHSRIQVLLTPGRNDQACSLNTDLYNSLLILRIHRKSNKKLILLSLLFLLILPVLLLLLVNFSLHLTRIHTLKTHYEYVVNRVTPYRFPGIHRRLSPRNILNARTHSKTRTERRQPRAEGDNFDLAKSGDGRPSIPGNR